MGYEMKIADEEFNITWNVAPMFYAAIPETGIRTIYGMTGADALPTLQFIRTYFEDNKTKLEAMEPSNGCGIFDNTYKCLCKMVRASMNNPTRKWSGD